MIAKQIPNQTDSQTRGYLVSMWVVAFLALLGLEMRVFTYASNAIILVALVVSFVISVFITRYWLVVRKSKHIPIHINNESINVKPQEAPKQLVLWVEERAKYLSLIDKINVLYIPHTWNIVDAFVYPKRREHYIVLTGGALTLFLRQRPEEQKQFEFLIDHELGHIANRDTNLLYLAKSLLFTVLWFVPIKIFLQFLFDWSRLLDFYADLFPRRVEMVIVGISGPGAVMQTVSEFPSSLAGFIIVVYTLLMIGLLVFFYVAIVRRREFWADRFALSHDSDKQHAITAFETLLLAPHLSTLPEHGFSGNSMWHPVHSKRIENVKATNPIYGFTLRQSSILIIIVLISFRFTLGNTGILRDWDTTPFWLIPLSFIFIAICGYCIACLVHPTQDDKSQMLQESITSSKELVKASTIVALVLWLIQWMLSRPGNRSLSYDYLESYGYRALTNIESIERTLLIFSIPLSIACFTAGYLIVYRLLQVVFRVPRVTVLNSIIASAIAAVILLGLSSLSDNYLINYRENSFAQYNSQRQIMLDGLTSDNPSLKSLRESDPFYNEADYQEEVSNFAELSYYEEKLVELRLLEHEFSPPLSLFLLWHAPFRSSVLL